MTGADFATDGLDRLDMPPAGLCGCGNPACPQPPFGPCPGAWPNDRPACRACGCSENDACLTEAGPCAWAEADLCTACDGIVQRFFSPAELAFLLHAAGGGDLNLTRPDAGALTAEGVLALRERLGRIAPKAEGHAAGDPGELACGICALGFIEGDPCLNDVELGPVHAACCGPERESYVGADGEPLKAGEPIPTPWIWSADHG